MKNTIYFSINDIAKATNRPIVGVCGVSYGAVELVVPISNEKGILFRHGDDEEGDHEVREILLKNANREHNL